MPDINRSYSWAIETCNAPNVGYSNLYRNQQKVNGITYYDCSSFINYALVAGGFDTPSYAPNNSAFTTYNEASVLLQLGFDEVDANGEYLPGDIGLNTTHTEMCYTGGQGKGVFMGAHTANASLYNQVSIGSSGGNIDYQQSFQRLFRYGGGASLIGSSIYVCAAIAGNMWQESGINPGIWENLSEGTWTDLLKGYGLGQWTNTGGDTHGRLYKLHTWLNENGYSDDDGDGQVKYISVENVWYKQGEAMAFDNLNAFLTTDVEDIELLTHAWNIGWEGIHDETWDLRVQYARDCYQFILQNANDSSINKWISGNRYLSAGERYNNAVMLYRSLSAGGGGGGKPTKKKKNMPAWMKIRYKI